jgi:hypothetical protein
MEDREIRAALEQHFTMLGERFRAYFSDIDHRHKLRAPDLDRERFWSCAEAKVRAFYASHREHRLYADNTQLTCYTNGRAVKAGYSMSGTRDSTLLVRVEDVILHLHRHMARVSAI